MSENGSDYYSDSNSDSDSESEIKIEKNNLDKKKQLIENAARKYGNYEEMDDSEPEEESDDSESEEDEVIVGGAEDVEDVEFDNESQKEEVKDEDEQKEDDDNDENDDDDDDIEINEEGVVIEKENKNKSVKPKKTSKLIIEEQDDEYDNDYDENYLQKFDSDLNKNYVNEFHPECLNHNYDEVLRLSKVVRNNSNIIIDPLHKTLPYLTKYEKARVLGQRAKQIETGSKPLVKVPENIIDGYVIAELELKEKKIPFIIKRPIPGGAFEYWKLNDLENINF
jgi:DNA-directed RNA polymerase I, II, and III subunit RPABC2